MCILLSCFINWVGIIGRGYSLFELGEFAATWGRYDNLWFLHIIGIAYLLIPVMACFVLMTLLFRRTSRVVGFIAGSYCLALTGILLMPSLFLPFGLPELLYGPGVFMAFISSLALVIGSFCSRKQYEIVQDAQAIS